MLSAVAVVALATTQAIAPGRTNTAWATTGPAPAGRVPPGFDPLSLSAVSTGTYWVLGAVPCPGHVCAKGTTKATGRHCDEAPTPHATPLCTWLVRTDDGGTSFVDLPPPPAPLLKGTYNAGSEGIDTISFANRRDGFAFAPYTTVGSAGSFWETHDGGRTWSEPPALANKFVVAVGTGGGFVLVLVAGDCGATKCADGVLLRSPLGTDRWTSLALPVPVTPNWGAAMTVVGRHLWISTTPGPMSSGHLYGTLLLSSSSGEGFRALVSPCLRQYTGSLTAISASVVWAVCPTGMSAEVLRSTDGGARWARLPTGAPSRFPVLAPISATTAVLGAGPNGQLLRTTDGGAAWRSVYPAMTDGNSWSWVGFSGLRTGWALQVQAELSRSPYVPVVQQLWQTSDGGSTWTGPVHFR